MRILHEPVGKLRDVDEAILVDADIDKGAEGGDIGHGALELHAHLQVLDVVDALGKGRGLEARARVTTRLFEFGENVLDGRQAEALVHESPWVELLQGDTVAHQSAHVAAAGGHDLLGDAIGFRMDGGGIERLLAVRDAQEACALFEGARAEPRHFQQFLAASKRPGRVTMRDDRLGRGFAEAGHPGKQRCRRRVDVDADGVHRVFHHRIERAAELRLVDVVLVLANADRLRLDLHKLGQRILQAAGDRDCTAQRNVEAGELQGGRFRCRVNRGAGFGNDDLGRLRRRQLQEHVGNELFGLTAAGSVADRDQLHLVLADQRGELGLRAANVVLRWERVDGRRFEQLAGAIDHRDLDAGADARIEAHRGPRSRRRGKQQVLEVAGEDVDRLLFGTLAQFAHQVERQRHGELHAPGPADHLGQPFVTRQMGADIVGGGDHALDRLYR
ncbi:hypothetical protein D9M68_529130 [compost metagenome]